MWASSFKLSVSPSAGIKPVSALTQISLLIWLKVPGCVPSQKNSFLVSQGESGWETRPVEVQTVRLMTSAGFSGQRGSWSLRAKAMMSCQIGAAPVTPETR